MTWVGSPSSRRSPGPRRPALARALAGLALAAGLALGGCNEPDRATEAGLSPVEGPLPWGGTPNVHRYGNLYLAGQPDAAGLEAARAAGVTAVVNLRRPGEFAWDEAGAVTAAGMAYHVVPVSGSGPLERATMDRIDDVVSQHDAVLVHCASGNRAAAWLAVHLVREEGLSVDEALAIARRAGITRERFASQVRDHLLP